MFDLYARFQTPFKCILFRFGKSKVAAVYSRALKDVVFDVAMATAVCVNTRMWAEMSLALKPCCYFFRATFMLLKNLCVCLFEWSILWGLRLYFPVQRSHHRSWLLLAGFMWLLCKKNRDFDFTIDKCFCLFLITNYIFCCTTNL